MSKKVLIRVAAVACFVAILLAVPLLAACGQSEPAPAPAPTPAPAPAPAPTPAPAPAPAPTPEPKPADLPDRIAYTQSGKGKGTPLLSYIAEMVTKYTPMSASLEEVTSPPQALKMIIAGESQGAMYAVPSPITGLTKEEQDQVRALYCGGGVNSATLYAVHTKPGAGINTLADLKGKDFYAEKPSITFFAATVDAFIGANGMTRDDLNWIQYDKGSDAFRDLKEGRVDALFYVAGSGSTEMGESTGMFVVPFDDAAIKAVEALGFGIMGMTWPAGSFGNETDTVVLGSPNVHWSSTAMSDDVAYAIVKAVWDNIEELQDSQLAGTGFTKENALLQWDFAYHDGAVKYFKEAGMWTSEMDAKQAALLTKYK